MEQNQSGPTMQEEEYSDFEKPRGWKKIFWIFTAVASALWMIWIPDPTDIAFGPFGLIDDGVAGMVLLYALGRLGVNIPIINRLVGMKNRKSKRRREKDVSGGGRVVN